MWFRVDDQMPKKGGKARHVRRSHATKRRDASPFGIWVIAGALSDDGWISLEELEDWDDDAENLAARLVAARLWHVEERNGESGYLFNDWHEYNPATGAKDAGSFGAHVRHHVNKKVVNPECPHCPSEPPMDPPEPSEVSPPTGVPNANRWHTRPDPTRPDPTKSNNSCSSTDVESVSDVDAEFAEWWSGYPRKVGKGQAVKAYRAARKKTDATTLTAALTAQRQALMSKGETYCPHASTWLNGERWADDASANPEPLTRTQQHIALARQLAAEESGHPPLGELA